jgi:hypothetical protein
VSRRQQPTGRTSAGDRAAHQSVPKLRKVHTFDYAQARSVGRAGWDRWATGYTVAGAAFVVIGGLVSAAAGPLGWSEGSWLAAYLVLVCGVAQCLFGVQRMIAPAPLGALGFVLVFAGWNLGNAAVVGGDLAGIPAVVMVGGVLLAAVLVVQLVQLRHSVPGRRVWAWGCGVVLVVLLLSIPVGVVLSAIAGGGHGHP